MIVFRNDVISRSRNGAIAELVVVRIGRHHSETVLGLDPADIVMNLAEQCEQCHHIPPSSSTGKLNGDLLVFKEYFGGQGKREAAIKQSAQYWIERLLAAKHLQEDAGIQTNRHE
jgi:hypothetical protein